MGTDAPDATATFRVDGERTEWFRAAFDVLPGLLDPVSSEGVAVAIAQGVVRQLAFAAAIDRLDPALGLQRVAFAWRQGVAAPVECRWAPPELPLAWRTDEPKVLPEDASSILFPPLARAQVLGVPLSVDGTSYGHLWLLGHVGEDFDEGVLGLASELGRWGSAALSRGRRVDSIVRGSERQADLAAVLEHDLRAPLGTLLGWSRLLASEPDARSERIRRGLAAIERGGRMMTRVVEDWHEASRMLLGSVVLDRRTTSVAATVRNVVEQRRASLAGSSTPVTLDCPDDLVASIDEERVRQMVERMLDRIERSTPVGGTISVQVAAHGAAVAVVAESRTPMPPRGIERSRDESQRDPGVGPNATRLGDRTLTLAVVRGIAELHGGSAGAETAGPTFGSRIWALLPVATVAAPPRALQAAPPERTDLRGVHVLLVDDARDSLELAAAIVRLRGAEAALASSTAEALDLLRTLPIDVLVSDIAMPVEDGCSLIRRAHELRPRLRAAALSAHAHAEDRQRALAAGFETYLTKPIDPDALARVIRSLAHEVPSSADRLP